MRKSLWSAIAIALYIVSVIGLEAVARDRRPSWWGWLLYLSAAITVSLFITGQFFGTERAKR